MTHAASTLRLSDYPMRKLDLPAPSVEVQNGKDGVLYMRCGIKYEAGPRSLIEYFQRAVELRPATSCLAQRDSNGEWRRLIYTDAWKRTTAIATWLIREGFGPNGQPVMILSENSIEHALLTLGALR